jgi:phosphatidylglycerophosphate synthase
MRPRRLEEDSKPCHKMHQPGTDTIMDTTPPLNRRELATRRAGWPHAIARALAGAGVTPNQFSVLSVVVALAGATLFATSNGRSLYLVLGAVAIQLRLLCNMLDGLLAIEGGLKSATGDLYNEVPDRFADVALFLGAGYAVPDAWGPLLAWSTALVAVLTAYVRLLGGSLGLTQEFIGPFAKQHRMFALTVGALVAAVEYSIRGTIISLEVTLVIIHIGSSLTFARRLVRIGRQLQTR